MRMRMAVAVLGMLAVVVVLGGMASLSMPAWWPGPAAAQGATLQIVGAPVSVSAGGSPFQIEVRVAGVTNLGGYEWQIAYDPAVVALTDPPTSAVSNGDFLGSTGRATQCFLLLPPAQGLQPGNVRYGCGSTGSAQGPSGSGLLSVVNFQPLASGSPAIQFVCGDLSDPLGENISVANVPECRTAITPTPGPGDTPVPTSTPGPGQPTATPTVVGPPAATPTALPTPLPGPREAIALVLGCNLRAFMPYYAPGTELIAIVVDITGGNPRLWFHIPATTAFDLFDFRSTERSTKTVLGPADEAGFICLDGDAIWNRPTGT